MADAKLDKKKLIPAGEAFDVVSFGVKAIQDTTQGLKKAFKARLQQQKQIKKDQKIAASRLLNKQKQKDKEKALEATPQKKKGGVKESIKKTSGSIFSRVMSAAAAVFVGWFMDKMPAILEGIQRAVETIQRVVGAVSGVFGGIFDALSGFYEGAKDMISGFNSKSLPKEEDVKGEWDSLDQELKGQADGVKESLGETTEAIKKFAKDNADKNTADPEKSPVGKADAELHSSTAEKPEGLDTDQHAKAMHPENYVEPDKADEEARKNFEKENPPEAQSPAKDAKKKPELDYNDQSKVVAADLAKIRPEDYTASAKPATISKSEPETPLIEAPPAVVTPAPSSSEAVGDGIKAPKIVTPSGLGMDMYSRKIILNPDAARGWKKLLVEAAKDGIDLTKAVTSSYRSPEKQRELIATEDGVNVITPAPVHQSPHVQGWAVDLATNTPEWNWMKKNAHKFGWRWQGESDPVHFDFMEGASSNTHWMEPGRNDWMQSNLNSGETVASIQTKPRKIVVPIPINTMRKSSPVGGGMPPMDNKGISSPKVGGINILAAMKTINRAYT